ncbi:MAG TPA: hypothetical protein VN843_02000 [Anaerolineales bacterium]|nr:hypothetical protein [Anaerolineales bacterium]
MKFNQKFLAALLTVFVVDDIKTKIEARKHAKVFLAATQAYEAVNAEQTAQISYLIHVLNKHEIEADEFDLIVLNNLIPEN